MIQSISKTPLLVLFVVSIVPLLLIEGQPGLWAFTIIICSNFFSIWAYSIVKHLNKKTKVKIKFSKFTLVLILLTVYVTLLSIYFALTFPDYDDPKWLLPIIIIGQMFLAWSLFYIIGFMAKLIAIVDLKRNVQFIDYIGYLVLLLFFPFGIWWVYPKIQSLIKA